MDTTDFFYPDGVIEASGNFLEESYDSVRFFAEECDSMQGIQVIFDSKNVYFLITIYFYCRDLVALLINI